jgi:pimeloyl-ACP methyl ester carboxylesterase
MRSRFLIAIAVVLALIVGALAAAWTPDRSVESLMARWAPPPSKFVTVDAMSVHMRDEGPRDDPHPLVLIHGTESSLHTWQGWVDILKARHRVIRLDLPGAGLTSAFPDGDYRIQHFSRFTADFLDQLGVKHAVVVGNSLGGQIAWEVSLARRDLVDRLVLIDSRGYPGEAGPPTAAEQLASVPIVGPFLIEHITPRGLIEKTLTKVVGDPSKLTPELVDRYYELILRTGNRHALILQIAQESYADSARIKSVSVPTLIMWGARDQHVPVPDANRFHSDISHSQLVVFERLGHTPQEEDPAQTTSALEAFLAAKPPS